MQQQQQQQQQQPVGNQLASKFAEAESTFCGPCARLSCFKGATKEAYSPCSQLVLLAFLAAFAVAEFALQSDPVRLFTSSLSASSSAARAANAGGAGSPVYGSHHVVATSVFGVVCIVILLRQGKISPLTNWIGISLLAGKAVTIFSDDITDLWHGLLFAFVYAPIVAYFPYRRPISSSSSSSSSSSTATSVTGRGDARAALSTITPTVGIEARVTPRLAVAHIFLLIVTATIVRRSLVYHALFVILGNRPSLTTTWAAAFLLAGIASLPLSFWLVGYKPRLRNFNIGFILLSIALLIAQPSPRALATSSFLSSDSAIGAYVASGGWLAAYRTSIYDFFFRTSFHASADAHNTYIITAASLPSAYARTQSSAYDTRATALLAGPLAGSIGPADDALPPEATWALFASIVSLVLLIYVNLTTSDPTADDAPVVVVGVGGVTRRAPTGSNRYCCGLFSPSTMRTLLALVTGLGAGLFTSALMRTTWASLVSVGSYRWEHGDLNTSAAGVWTRQLVVACLTLTPLLLDMLQHRITHSNVYYSRSDIASSGAAAEKARSFCSSETLSRFVPLVIYVVVGIALPFFALTVSVISRNFVLIAFALGLIVVVNALVALSVKLAWYVQMRCHLSLPVINQCSCFVSSYPTFLSLYH